MFEFLWTCVKVCIIILMFPVIVITLMFLGMFVLPVFFIAVPIMCIAWLWLLFA